MRTRAPASWRAVAVLTLPLVCAVGCERSEWTMFSGSRAPDEAVMDALDDFDYSSPREIGPHDVPVVPPPTKLRPCCAFGTGLKV